MALPPDKRGALAPGIEYSVWQLVEHMRLAQLDVLDFCLNANYVHAMKWPDDYWPQAAPADAQAWDRSVAGFKADRERLKEVARDETHRSPRAGPDRQAPPDLPARDPADGRSQRVSSRPDRRGAARVGDVEMMRQQSAADLHAASSRFSSPSRSRIPRPGQAQAQAPTGRETSAASVASYALSQQMPVDPEVLVGGLPNGLRFYVRPNGKPARQAELRLVVKAGSVLEDDDQRGLAHFVEHMQFEGSRHFPGQRHQRFPRRRSA